jgi:transcriptional activator for dhaKLM operon
MEGVLYIQDVDLLPLEAQNILLNFKTGVIKHRGSGRKVEVNVRVICATSCSLEKLVSEGKFSPDLLFWLRTFQIDVPPLRSEDIIPLAQNILDRLSSCSGFSICLAPGVLEQLRAYDWPGNIRELEIVLEQSASRLRKSRQQIEVGDLPPLLWSVGSLEISNNTSSPQPPLLDQMQEEALLRIARESRGNVSEMARKLGIGRTTVWRWMKRMGLSPDEFRGEIA